MAEIITPELIGFFVVGFLAQIIDGSLGMAYGVSANSFLMGLGVPPALASASVHTAEVFTTAASGLSHWRLGNVNWQIIKRLAVFGVGGGIIGAYVLSNVDGSVIKPWVALYLLAMGIRILVKAFRPVNGVSKALRQRLPILGLFGGFMDALDIHELERHARDQPVRVLHEGIRVGFDQLFLDLRPQVPVLGVDPANDIVDGHIRGQLQNDA